MKKMTYIAVGDAFITRESPRTPQFYAMSRLLLSADLRLCNLETTFASEAASPAAVSGGTWARTRKELLAELTAYGFNAFSAATNHALDFGERGLLDTVTTLTEAGVAFAGAGIDLAEAHKASYIKTQNGTVALISLASSFHETAVAGMPRHNIKGRPGINPLRHKTTYSVTPDDLARLQEIAEKTGINAREKLRLKEGFSVDDGGREYAFGGIRFQASPAAGAVSMPDERDVQRTVEEIQRARAQVEGILVSLHTHEMKNGDKLLPADFIIDAAHRFIDAGAHAIVCHGPHVMRGIEIYKRRPIFYSLGNFIFQNETVAALPSDFYEKYGLDMNASTQEAFDKRSKGDTVGLVTNKDVWRAVIPRWTMRDGELEEMTLHPISLGFGLPRSERGTPVLSDDKDALLKMQALCEPFGTSIVINDENLASIQMN